MYDKCKHEIFMKYYNFDKKEEDVAGKAYYLLLKRCELKEEEKEIIKE